MDNENFVIDMYGRKMDLTGRVPFRAKETVKITPELLGKRDDTVVIWLAGGGFLINSRGTVILIDPCVEMDKENMIGETGHKMLMEYPITAYELPDIAAACYTHSDDDHVGRQTSKILAEKHTHRIAPARVAKILYEEGGVEPIDMDECLAGQKYRFSDVVIEVIPSDHPWQLINPDLYGEPLKREDACGYVVRTPDGSILCCGDTRLIPSHYNIPGINVVCLDTAKCAFHMNVEGSFLLANHYRNAYLIPYHYGVFDYPACPAQEQGDPQDVLVYVHDADKRARILAPGEPFFLKDHKENI